MKITKEFHLTLILFGIYLIPFNLSGINKYTVVVHQPNPIKNCVINWVTVSEDDKNQIAWQKQVNDNIVYYNVYRNSTDSDIVWELAGTVDYNSETYLNDLNSYARIQSYRYRIAAVDKCGNETYSNIIFRTIFLKFKEAIDGTYTIEWNPYEGINVTAYRIYKGTTPFNLAVVDSTSSTTTNYTDKVLNSSNNYYQVEAVGYEYDSIPVQLIKPNYVKAVSNQVKSVSNIISSNYDSILNPFENESLHIYPNPLEIASVVQFPYDPAQHYQLIILDMLGNIVYQQSVLSGEFLINQENLNAGLYILQIKGKKSIQKKLIIGGNKL